MIGHDGKENHGQVLPIGDGVEDWSRLVTVAAARQKPMQTGPEKAEERQPTPRKFSRSASGSLKKVVRALSFVEGVKKESPKEDLLRTEYALMLPEERELLERLVGLAGYRDAAAYHKVQCLELQEELEAQCDTEAHGNDKLEATLAQRNDQCLKLQTELDAAAREREQLEASSSQRNKQCLELQSELAAQCDAAGREREQLKTHLAQYADQCLELQTQLDRAQENVRTQMSEKNLEREQEILDDIDTQAEFTVGRVVGLAVDDDAEECEREQLDAIVSHHKDQCRKLQIELAAQRDAAAQEREQLEEMLSVTHSNVQYLEFEQNYAHAREREQLEANLAECNDQYLKLQTERDLAQKDLDLASDMLANQRVAAAREHEQLEAMVAHMKDQCLELQTEQENVQDDLQMERDAKDALKIEFMVGNSVGVAELEAILSDLNDRCIELQNQLAAQCDTAAREREQLEAECSRRNDQCLELQTELAVKRDAAACERENLKTELESVLVHSSNQELQCSKLETQHDELQTELAAQRRFSCEVKLGLKNMIEAQKDGHKFHEPIRNLRGILAFSGITDIDKKDWDGIQELLLKVLGTSESEAEQEAFQLLEAGKSEVVGNIPSDLPKNDELEAQKILERVHSKHVKSVAEKRDIEKIGGAKAAPEAQTKSEAPEAEARAAPRELILPDVEAKAAPREFILPDIQPVESQAAPKVESEAALESEATAATKAESEAAPESEAPATPASWQGAPRVQPGSCLGAGESSPEVTKDKAEAKAAPESEAKIAPEREVKAAPEPEAKAAPQSEARAEPEPKAKAAPESEARAAPEPKAKAAPESEARAARESEGKARAARESEPQTLEKDLQKPAEPQNELDDEGKKCCSVQ